MAPITGISNMIARVPVPRGAQRFFLETAKEGRNALLPTELSVITGRSIQEFIRSGFIGFQERFTEELLAAWIWLFGVESGQKVFDKIAPKLFKDGDRLSGKIAWNMPWRNQPHVDLSAQELFTRDAKDARQLFKIKSSRWFITVGTAIALAAYVIPKLNQLKTNLVLNYMDKKEAKESGSGQPSSDTASGGAKTPSTGNTPASSTSPGTQPSTISPQPASQPFNPPFASFPQPFQPNTAQSASTLPNTTIPALSGSLPFTQPGLKQPNMTQPNMMQPAAFAGGASKPGTVRFGGPFSSMMEGVGRLVDQSDYGDILVVDTGITGGRGYVESKRSIFGTVEIIFRDVVSLFFYIMAAPLVMKGMAKLLDPAFKTSMQMEPKVAEQLHARILNDLAARTGKTAQELENAPLDIRALQRVLYGASIPEIPNLGDRMRTARFESGEGFHKLLGQEAAAYFQNAERAQSVTQLVTAYLKPRVSGKQVNSQHIQQLLTAILDAKGGFGTLSREERQNLALSVKQAFRHTVGVSEDQLLQAAAKLFGIKDPLDSPAGLQALEAMKPTARQEFHALQDRIREMALLDSQDQAKTMFRRSLNLVYDHIPRPNAEQSRILPPVLQHATRLADLLDRSANKRIGLQNLLNQELEELHGKLQRLTLSEDVHLPTSLDSVTPSHLERLETVLKATPGRKATKALEQLANLRTLTLGMDTAQPLTKIGDAELGRNVTRLLDTIKNSLHDETPQEIRTLLEHYQSAIANMQESGAARRVFSLFTDSTDPEFTRKLEALNQGGILNDTAFQRRMMDIVGHFNSDSRLYNSPGKAKQMHALLEKYGKALLEDAEGCLQSGSLKLSNWKPVLDKFLKLNSNLHYGSRLLAMGTAMVGLGVLVPKMQYALTKQLTGKDENPGIGSAMKAHQKGGQKGSQKSQPQQQQQPQQAPAAPQMAGGPALNRNHFQSFQQQQRPV